MKRYSLFALIAATVVLAAYPHVRDSRLAGCVAYGLAGWRAVATERAERFLGKVSEHTARCRGGQTAVAWRKTPWLDWSRYFSAGGQDSRYSGWLERLALLNPNNRGIHGALLDLEYQRIELLKFNLFDNHGTYPAYARAPGAASGRFARSWPEFKLPEGHPLFASAGGEGAQKCSGEVVRFRTVTGICNDLVNPLMGATGQAFARNVEFESTFPEQSEDEIAKNRHGDRIGLLKPDPQVISRTLFSRGLFDDCSGGKSGAAARECPYEKANHLNLLAAFWIQFMTHDWFSHLEEGRNQAEWIPLGCVSRRAGATERPLTAEEIAALRCRPGDRIDKSLVAEARQPPVFVDERGTRRLARAPKTTANKVTAWWDASQIYGYDENSRQRVKRDPADPAKLLLEAAGDKGSDTGNYLPLLKKSDPQNPRWDGQEAVAFPDNWNIGLSFFHNVFAREHNFFVEAFRRHAAERPDADSGLRHPARPDRVIAHKEITADELFEIARLVISAEIAKIHTIEWTTQLLYNEPLHLAMNANWSGLLQDYPLVRAALARVLHRAAGVASEQSTVWYAAFAAGPGIVGLGNRRPDVNGGINHFGSPFNFPEEFINAYRLHPMIPDVLELRSRATDPNVIAANIPAAATIRGEATVAMRRHGITDWAVSLGRQRMGRLTLHNHPLFLQNLDMPRLQSATGKIDVAALDILRDRERGMPRYNEFRRQYGLKQLTGFDDFIDPRLPPDSPDRARQQKTVSLLREIYGQHECDATKMITRAQRNDDGSPINDCLGRPHGSRVDNIEDVDALVGWLAEFVRPHGFAISETQFQVFILNASRRLFSDRFLTSSFRPEFYTHFGLRWVNESGPDGKVMEKGESNGHAVEVSPLKRVLLRTIPELKDELDPVINAFDPWARDRGEYYSLQWKPRRGTETDSAFRAASPRR